MALADFFASPLFRFLLFPVSSALLGVGVKYVTRNDSYARFQKEDLAVGLELLLTACLMFLAITSDRSIEMSSLNRQIADALASNDVAGAQPLQARALALSQELTSAAWVLLAMFVGLWSVSTLVRKVGWQSKEEMRPVLGIALPLIIGILGLIVVMASAS
jgi:hypothetical protein